MSSELKSITKRIRRAADGFDKLDVAGAAATLLAQAAAEIGVTEAEALMVYDRMVAGGREDLLRNFPTVQQMRRRRSN